MLNLKLIGFALAFAGAISTPQAFADHCIVKVIANVVAPKDEVVGPIDICFKDLSAGLCSPMNTSLKTSVRAILDSRLPKVKSVKYKSFVKRRECPSNAFATQDSSLGT